MLSVLLGASRNKEQPPYSPYLGTYMLSELTWIHEYMNNSGKFSTNYLILDCEDSMKVRPMYTSNIWHDFIGKMHINKGSTLIRGLSRWKEKMGIFQAKGVLGKKTKNHELMGCLVGSVG